MNKIPNKEQIEKFLEIYDRLAMFEGTQRLIRQHGAFTKEEIRKFPIPEVEIVYNWLKKLTLVEGARDPGFSFWLGEDKLGKDKDA